MSTSFSATGGANVGWVNATWPLARLKSSSSKLELSVLLLGKYEFTPDQVVFIDQHSIIPVLGWGVRIHHSRTDYPKRIIFWSLDSPSHVLKGISQSGFNSTSTIAGPPQRTGIPIRWSAIVVAILAWNIPFLISFAFLGREFGQLSPVMLIPLIGAFTASIALMKVPGFQACVMKPKRSVGEILPFVRLLAFVSGILSVAYAIIFICGGLK
jgi:hypothetical protein